jgi:hypothetical protein
MSVISDVERRIPATRLIGSRPGSLVVAMIVRRRLQDAMERADRAMTDPHVHREVRRAAAHASRATRRARSVGAANAISDRCVVREMRRTRRHLGRAADMAAHPRRSHRARNVALACAAGAAAAAFAARRAQAGPEQVIFDQTEVVISAAAL